MSSKSFQNADSLNTQKANANKYGLKVGDSTYWLQDVWRSQVEDISTLDVLSPFGTVGVTGASRTSNSPNTYETQYSCIGGNFYAINDQIAINPATSGYPVRTAYALYYECIRTSGAGAAYGAEVDIANLGDVADVTPSTPLGDFWPNHKHTGALLLNSGAGRPGVNSASFGLLFGNNGAAFKRGIVFSASSVDPSTLDAIVMPIAYNISWYYNDTKESYITHSSSSQNVSDDVFNGFDDKRRRRIGNTATQYLDTIYRLNFFGRKDASTDYTAGYIRSLQRSAFSGGNASFSLDLAARTTTGAETSLTLNGIADNTFCPIPDNTISLGIGSFRWSVVYAATGTINTSDEREKQDIELLSEAESRVAKTLKGLVRKFRFKDAVAEKGDAARIHFGVIAQDVKAAFEAEGLVAERYGILCFDQWEELPEVKNEKSEVVQVGRSAGSRYGVRYEELLAFIISAL